MSKLAHSHQPTMDEIERMARDAPAVNDEPPQYCPDCGGLVSDDGYTIDEQKCCMTCRAD